VLIIRPASRGLIAPAIGTACDANTNFVAWKRRDSASAVVWSSYLLFRSSLCVRADCPWATRCDGQGSEELQRFSRILCPL